MVCFNEEKNQRIKEGFFAECRFHFEGESLSLFYAERIEEAYLQFEAFQISVAAKAIVLAQKGNSDEMPWEKDKNRDGLIRALLRGQKDLELFQRKFLSVLLCDLLVDFDELTPSEEEGSKEDIKRLWNLALGLEAETKIDMAASKRLKKSALKLLDAINFGENALIEEWNELVDKILSDLKGNEL